MGKFGVVIAAAGKGSRMKTEESKQYLLLQNKPILVHTIEKFQNIGEVDTISLVVGTKDIDRCERLVMEYGLSKVDCVIAGGSERQNSVFLGLKSLPSGIDCVLIHDAVRPFILQEHIIRCWEAAVATGAAVLAVPVKDTIKIVDDSGCIIATPDRRSLWSIQTPQAFRLPIIMDAHERAAKEQIVGTDDSMLAERAGIAVHVIEGSYTNIKITTPEDLIWAETILRQATKEEER